MKFIARGPFLINPRQIAMITRYRDSITIYFVGGQELTIKGENAQKVLQALLALGEQDER